MRFKENKFCELEKDFVNIHVVEIGDMLSIDPIDGADFDPIYYDSDWIVTGFQNENTLELESETFNSIVYSDKKITIREQVTNTVTVHIDMISVTRGEKIIIEQREG
jgi:hypothetical protein